MNTPVTYAAVCEVCGQGLKNGVAIYRTGGRGRGIDPKWRCSAHLSASYTKDPEVEIVVAVIESNQQSKH